MSISDTFASQLNNVSRALLKSVFQFLKKTYYPGVSIDAPFQEPGRLRL